MSIRSGQYLFSADNGFVLDRIQQGGVSNLNIPQELVYEIGDYQSVAIIRDIPDLSFMVETADISCELESMVFGGANPTDTDVSAPAPGTWYDFNANLPLDVISPFRSAYNAYNIINGIATPQLYLESVAYRFGVRQNSAETWTMRGDSVFYIPGSPFLEQFTATSNQTVFTCAHNSLTFVERSTNRFALNVSVNGVRKFPVVDYTETASPLTVTFLTGLTTGDVVRIVYGSVTPNTSFPSTEGTPAPLSVKPAAVRGKDIDVYVQVPGATPDMIRWDGVQAANVNWNVNLTADEEFGNYHYVTEDYVTATVKGDITVLPVSTANLFNKIAQVADVPAGQIIGALTSQPLELEVRIYQPDTSTVIKTMYVPDARFVPPATSGRVNQKLTPQFTWQSDSGLLFAGAGLPTSRPTQIGGATI